MEYCVGFAKFSIDFYCSQFSTPMMHYKDVHMFPLLFLFLDILKFPRLPSPIAPLGVRKICGRLHRSLVNPH